MAGKRRRSGSSFCEGWKLILRINYQLKRKQFYCVYPWMLRDDTRICGGKAFMSENLVVYVSERWEIVGSTRNSTWAQLMHNLNLKNQLELNSESLHWNLTLSTLLYEFCSLQSATWPCDRAGMSEFSWKCSCFHKILAWRRGWKKFSVHRGSVTDKRNNFNLQFLMLPWWVDPEKQQRKSPRKIPMLNSIHFNSAHIISSSAVARIVRKRLQKLLWRFNPS